MHRQLCRILLLGTHSAAEEEVQQDFREHRLLQVKTWGYLGISSQNSLNAAYRCLLNDLQRCMIVQWKGMGELLFFSNFPNYFIYFE